jgi:CHAD domain-containing protein
MTTPGAASDVAVVTMAAVYAEQVKMSAQLAVISDRLGQLPDHEVRLRKLEAWKYALPPATMAGLSSFVLSIWAVIHR